MLCKIVIASVLLISLVSGYSPCDSKTKVIGSVVSLSISGCDNDDTCILKRKTNATIEIGFSTTVNSDALKAVVHGVFLGMPVPFDLPNPDGCKDSGVACPISSGTNYVYKTSLPVLGSYPRVSVDVKWELRDKNGDDIICILIPAKIK